jgi:hypothetical protein
MQARGAIPVSLVGTFFSARVQRLKSLGPPRNAVSLRNPALLDAPPCGQTAGRYSAPLRALPAPAERPPRPQAF